MLEHSELGGTGFNSLWPGWKVNQGLKSWENGYVLGNSIVKDGHYCQYNFKITEKNEYCLILYASFSTRTGSRLWS